MQAAGFLPPGAGIAQVRGMLRVFTANSSARYTPQDVRPVPIVLFRAGEFHRDYDFSPADDPGHQITESSMGWRAYAKGEVAIHVVPGNHITMMSEPHVAQLAEQIMKCLVDVRAMDHAVSGTTRLLRSGDAAPSGHDSVPPPFVVRDEPAPSALAGG